MITKQTWEIYRSSEEMPLFIIYDFYVEHKKPEKKTMTYSEFEIFFPQFIKNYDGVELIFSDNSKKYIHYGDVVYRISIFYNEFYSSTIL